MLKKVGWADGEVPGQSWGFTRKSLPGDPFSKGRVLDRNIYIYILRSFLGI